MSDSEQQHGGYDEARMLPQSPLVSPSAIVSERYELQHVLGYGGMGTVWTARRVDDGTPVAIKFVSVAHTDSPDTLKRFSTEAQAASTLHGRNVVQVFDHGELSDGTPFMVMELLEGQPLSERIEQEAPLSLAETFRIIRHVGQALTAAHDKGIIHRDIKPENVFLSKAAGGYEAKVLDFGVAKFLEGKGGGHARTKTGVLVGTPLYMSPEQVRGLKTVDHRSDIYALGALGFAMLTGHEVFPEKNFGELLFKICTSDLPSVCDENPDVPSAVDDWFHKSCARSPNDRFSSVETQVKAFAAAAKLPMQPSLMAASETPEPATSKIPGEPPSRTTAVRNQMDPHKPKARVSKMVLALSVAIVFMVALVAWQLFTRTRADTASPVHVQTSASTSK